MNQIRVSPMEKSISSASRAYPGHIRFRRQTRNKKHPADSFPGLGKKTRGRKFDLMLAGHSHGCQVRIPFYGPFMVPYAVDEYDLGLFQTKSGPLYVTAGIGYYPTTPSVSTAGRKSPCL